MYVMNMTFYKDLRYDNLSTEYDVAPINSQQLFRMFDQELLCVNFFIGILLHVPIRTFIETISQHHDRLFEYFPNNSDKRTELDRLHEKVTNAEDLCLSFRDSITIACRQNNRKVRSDME